ncbi:MAG: aminotransferase class I/II-fold pyridoxal phosphate-dependent enzyme, partial [Firmicutes bacterium]|nr:aminotransferase class I/II-fold pyridoxal phosphate-dependent enzyme [Bacillota bacterium]
MDYDKLLSKTVQEVRFSGIRKFFDIASTVENVISLSVGEPDFKTPWAVRKEAIKTLEKGKTAYTANAGLIRLRESIASYIHRRIGVSYDPKSEIIVTVGGSEAIDCAFRAICDPGDEVIVPANTYIASILAVSENGLVPVLVEPDICTYEIDDSKIEEA